MVVTSFLLFMAAFLGIGLASVLRSDGSRKDYYLASQKVSPMLAGLSAVATNNSGYMFIGVIGFTYTAGLSAIWLMIGWITGDFIASLFIHRRLRAATEWTKEASFGSVLARWRGVDMPVWRRLAAVVTILFLGAYAAAQIAAGGKALQGVLGWDPETGAWMVATMVLVYSAAGGIRASIWTDAAQSFVMLVAMALLFAAGVSGFGGWQAVLDGWRAVPGFFDLTPPDLLVPGFFGLSLFVIGWMFAGISVIGQPHIMARFMALDKPASMNRARVWYYGFFIAFYGLATVVGLLSRLYLPDLGGMDAELALPTMAVHLLPPMLTGLVLAGIFAATMSTADSLVLSCSAALTHDLSTKRFEHPWLMKGATALVTGLALFIALSNSSSVFSLVIFAWSALAVAFGPLLILLSIGRHVSERRAILMMLAGLAVALAWRSAGLEGWIYEGLPGILTGLAIGWPSGASATLQARPSETAATTRT